MSSKHIIFLQSAHYSTDERVLYHQAVTLRRAGHTVAIYGMETFAHFTTLPADIYIVDTPRAMWKIKHTSAQIIYDITEWYPSKKNLRNIRLGKVSKALLMFIANLWAGHRANAFIFGEEDKAKPFQRLFPKKPALALSYYPDLKYIKSRPHVKSISQECRMLYAGALTKEKGWLRVQEVVQTIAEKYPHTTFHLDVITRDEWSDNLSQVNLTINILPFMSFEEFCEQITQYDLFLDLRDIDMENTRCLPIKLFYYIACGRPAIYSNLNAIKKGFPEVEQCTQLVANSAEAVEAIEIYMNDNRYHEHCTNARRLAIEKYNWNKLTSHLTQFIDDL